MTAILLPAALVGYIVGIVLAAIGTLYRSNTARRAASSAWGLTWLAQLGAIIALGAASGHVPLTNRAEYLLMLSWAVLTLHLYAWFRLQMPVSGLVLPPLAAVAAFSAWGLLGSTPHSDAIRPEGWFLFHTTVSTLGVANLCLACAMSVLYLFQDRALKSKKTLGLLERLPALDKCDRIGFQAMVAGFVLLTLGIGTGVVMNRNLHERFVVLGAKQVFPVLAWLVFAGIIASRRAFGFRGRKSAYLTIAGFALGLLTVIGMTL